MSTKVGNLISQRRRHVGLTQGELARSARVTREWISQVESGRIVQPGFKQLEALAYALELPAETLLAPAGYHVQTQGVPPQRATIDLVREVLARLEEEERKNESPNPLESQVGPNGGADIPATAQKERSACLAVNVLVLSA